MLIFISQLEAFLEVSWGPLVGPAPLLRTFGINTLVMAA